MIYFPGTDKKVQSCH